MGEERKEETKGGIDRQNRGGGERKRKIALFNICKYMQGAKV